jgi:hypothetical protein
VEEDGSLGLSLLHLDVSVENNNLGLGGGFVSGLRSSNAEHTVDDFRVLDASTENLSDTDVFAGESLGVNGKGVNGGSGDEVGEEVLESELLGGNCGFNATGHLGFLTEVLGLVAGEGLDESEGFVTGLLVSDEDLGGMESHLDEGDGLAEEFSRERNNKVGTITGFALLHFGGLGDHLGGGMVDIGLSDDSAGVGGDEKSLKVVDDHLVHAYKSVRDSN